MTSMTIGTMLNKTIATTTSSKSHEMSRLAGKPSDWFTSDGLEKAFLTSRFVGFALLEDFNNHRDNAQQDNRHNDQLEVTRDVEIAWKRFKRGDARHGSKRLQLTSSLVGLALLDDLDDHRDNAQQDNRHNDQLEGTRDVEIA
jgi:hypothetical protein